MQGPLRKVLPELLDELCPDDPRAQRSRRDLRRVHRAMRSVSILRKVIASLRLPEPPRTIIELGAGDGTLLLRLAEALAPRWPRVELTLVDQHDLVCAETRDRYRRLNWKVSVQCADVFAWARGPAAQSYDLCVATLFLHHFETAALIELLAAVARCTQAFVACEPRRDALSRLASFGIGLIGGNAVTREDGVKSVAAGFRARELTALWGSANGGWTLNEHREFPFTHCFSAVRASTQAYPRDHAI